MKSTLIFAAFIVMTGFIAAFGQTAAEIEKQYRAPVKAYIVRSNIWMTPEYTAEGQVCRMYLYPRVFSESTVFVDNRISFGDFKEAIDRLVPDDARGAAKETPFGRTATGGGAMWTVFDYEKVRIVYSAGFVVEGYKILDRGDFLFSEEFAKYPPTPPVKPLPPTPEEIYAGFKGQKYEIVTIKWTGRMCPGEL